MEMCEEIGTRKYNIMINKEYFVDFQEVEDNKGKGSYSNGEFGGFNAVHSADKIITSENKEEAKIIEGKFNLKSFMNKWLSNDNYKFYNIEIIEIE